MALVDSYENQLLDALFNGGTLTPPSNWWIGLSTSTPNDSGGSVTEPNTANGYARKEVTAWDSASGGEVANTNAIRLDPATGSWGNITHIVIFDAATGGNVVAYGPLTDGAGTPTPVSINNGDLYEFAAGSISIRID